MQRRQIKALESARRVQAFLDSRATALGFATSPSLRSQLDAAVADLTAQQLEQGTAQVLAQIETALQAAYRRHFYLCFIRPIAAIAKVRLRNFGQSRGLVMSEASTHASRFAANAATLAHAAEEHEAVFVRNGMAVEFLEQMQVALSQITASAEASARYKCRHVAATAAMRTVSRSAQSIVGVLDSLLAPALKRDAALRAEWVSCKRAQPSALPSDSSGRASTEKLP